ncbi:MarR family winged helix-turn-helix transcriptional regulator [Actinomadura sp. HBU206391]|uniref:MarR family winged helix-turn-helix transcriptional regulator n=1 Tax=Actinomadura sp. HBU206391 TaxID=2731692 RepID=UPI0029058348|nr:MarR family transcriptional regulator [Actinomadura sp. HBU206391]
MTLSAREQAETARALEEISRFVVRQMAALPEIGFTGIAALSMLESAGPRRITELAVDEGISQPSMTAMVSRLEQHGLVERRRDPSDGRIVLVAITDAGREMIRRRRAGRAAFLSSLIGSLDPAEQRALADAAPALRHLIDHTVVAAALDAAKQATADERGRK